MTVTEGDALLSVRDLDVGYGPVQVLFGLDLDIHRGELVALLGTNGAGKSTLFKAVTGLLTPTRGKVTFDGKDITGHATDQVTAGGIVMMPGGRSVFPTLTVRDNLRLACWTKRKQANAVKDAEERVLTMFPRLAERIEQMAGNLSGGEQQMLAIGQALIPNPTLLLIDELSLGLAPTVVGQLVDVVKGVHAQGLTVVVVEQSVNVALNLAERAVFMEKGSFRFSGPTRELLERPDILRSVFIAGASAVTGEAETNDAAATNGAVATNGAAANGTRRRRGDGTRAPLRARGKAAEVAAASTPVVVPKHDGPVVLECKEVVKTFGGITAVDGVDLTLHAGQILGLIGQNGAGKTTLFDCVSGFLPIDRGHIVLHGEDITELRPEERAARGLGRSFQEARLYPSLTTSETIQVARERHLERSMVAASFGQPRSRASEVVVRRDAELLLEVMGLASFAERLTGELSTGTRRIVELACLLAADPSVIVLDEPSGGVAQKETEALGPLLQRVQAFTGTSILVIEHDMPLLAGICDELVALELGAVIARGSPTEVLAHPRVIESYLGTDATVINRSGSVA